jgi:hypothetical protein
VNDQPPHTTPPTSANSGEDDHTAALPQPSTAPPTDAHSPWARPATTPTPADPTAASSEAGPPAADPTAAPSAAAPAGSEPTAVQPVVTQPGTTQWPGDAGPVWQPAPAFGNPPPPQPGTQSGPAYEPPQAGGYPDFPAPDAPGYPPPGSGGTSGFAIASLIFGILGGVLFSVVFGIVALVQIRKRGQTGRGLAIAGLAISACWVLVIIGGVTAALLSDSHNDSADSATESVIVSISTLKPGDCINGPQPDLIVEYVPLVACSLPHEGEVYAVFQLPAGPYPGDIVVEQQAERRCEIEFWTYVPNPPDTAQMMPLHPLSDSWKHDRGVTCVAYDERGLTTGSVRD